ncbi:MAG: glycosyltransferase family 2 protein, partial [Chloroflexi bacterium]|nr:glycosyltransferase family 2 protein [Chloroflexota bacterium]
IFVERMKREAPISNARGRQAGVHGEIIIVDSSSDRTAEIVESKGARAIRVPRRGLGRAYIDALPYVRGKYVIMGDCDLTYDFREIKMFVDALNQGFEFVIGTRMKGYIEPGAMPALHRYFGTPVTTRVLNAIYGSRYSDIHCGMRAMTLDALKRLDLQSQSWEYASEMVSKAARLKLRTAEVPIRFYKDRPGRTSHHKRSGWLSPWLAGWINLKAMFLYAPDFFLLKPGLVSLVVGVLLTLILAGGPVTIGALGLNLHWMLLGLTLATTGYTAVQLGVLARAYYDFDPLYTRKLKQLLSYNRGVIGGAIITFVGVALNIILVINWLSSGLQLSQFYHPGILGLLLIIFGFQTFTFTLMFGMVTGKSPSGGIVGNDE